MTWAWGEVLGGATVTRAPRGWGSAGTAFQEGFLEVVLALRLHDGDDRVPWEAPEGSHADHMWPSWVHRASVNFHASAPPRGWGRTRAQLSRRRLPHLGSSPWLLRCFECPPSHHTAPSPPLQWYFETFLCLSDLNVVSLYSVEIQFIFHKM